MKYLTSVSSIIFTFILALFCITSADAQWVDIGVHDPVMAEQNGTYYIFHTGRGISVWSSPDLENWEKEEPVFEKAPEWTYDVNPEFKN